jgi:hypothetical protein
VSYFYSDKDCRDTLLQIDGVNYKVKYTEINHVFESFETIVKATTLLRFARSRLLCFLGRFFIILFSDQLVIFGLVTDMMLVYLFCNIVTNRKHGDQSGPHFVQVSDYLRVDFNVRHAHQACKILSISR